MRVNVLITSLALLGAAALGTPSAAAAATFGKLVVIGGSASDIALDESRGNLYIADFGASVINVMSLADNSIHSQINVAAQPAALSISPDGQYLIAASYSSATVNKNGLNGVTLIRLSDRTQQTFSTGDGAIGVSFYLDAQNALQALILTNASILTLDPVTGRVTLLDTYQGLASSLPVDFATTPGQITKGAISTSADGHSIWGVAGAGTGSQLVFRYDTHRNYQSTLNRSTQVAVYSYVSSPSLLPRVTVSDQGTNAIVGWGMFSADGLKNGYYSSIYLLGRYPNVLSATSITGVAMDSKDDGSIGTVYAQFPDANQPTGPALSSSQPAVQASSVNPPAFLILDADNLAFRDRVNIPENMTGRAMLNSDRSVLYAISESGVMVLPVGSLKQSHRIAASQQDIFVGSSFCNRGIVTQTLTITDPGGGNTDFTITPATGQGVTVSPSSGMTPATVQVRIDPSAFSGANGTSTVSLNVSSSTAVDQVLNLRVLVNNPDSNQRGTVVNLPGSLTDVIPDASRNRFYIARSDMNTVYVFDGASNKQMAALRTYTTPTMMSVSADGTTLLIGHDDSQLIAAYDLNSLQRIFPVVLPGGHYGRSIAASNGRTFAIVRDETDGSGAVDNLDVVDHIGTKLPSLGIYTNKVAANFRHYRVAQYGQHSSCRSGRRRRSVFGRAGHLGQFPQGS